MCMCVRLSELTGTKCLRETPGEKRVLSDPELQWRGAMNHNEWEQTLPPSARESVFLVTKLSL